MTQRIKKAACYSQDWAIRTDHPAVFAFLVKEALEIADQLGGSKQVRMCKALHPTRQLQVLSSLLAR
jgi:hypothetical protein